MSVASGSKGQQNPFPPLRVLLLPASRSQSKNPFSGLLFPVLFAAVVLLALSFLKYLFCFIGCDMLGKGRTTDSGHSSRFLIMGEKQPCRQGRDKCYAPLTTLQYFTKIDFVLTLDTLETIQG